MSDLTSIGLTLLDTLGWVLFSLLLGALCLFLVDKATHRWFDLKSIGNDPRAVATFAAGLVIAIAVIVAGVIMSPGAAPAP